MATSRKTPAVDTLDGKLSRLDPEAAARSRLLHDRRLALALRDVDPTLTLTPARGAPAGVVRHLHLRCDAGDLEVLFAAANRPSLEMLETAPDAADSALNAAALEAAFGAVCEALGLIGLSGARAIALRDHEGESDAPWCVLRRENHELASFQLLTLPRTVREAVAATVAQIGEADAEDRPNLPVPGAVTLSHRAIRKSLLESLAPGDVLLLDVDHENHPTKPCRVRFGFPGRRACYATAIVDDDTITIEGEPCMSNDREEDLADGFNAPDNGGLESLELPVRFEVETAAMSLSALQALGAGAVIPLAMPLKSARVRLVTCGRVIGHAELVAVGDRLGALIVRMATAHDHRQQ